MSMSNVIMNIPWWYYLFCIIFSLFYAIRGIMEQAIDSNNKSRFTKAYQRIIILYVQEFLFKVTFTLSGFMALFMANYIFSSLKSFDDINPGIAIILIFLIFWGITGVSGYLTFIIVSGKFPNIKP